VTIYVVEQCKKDGQPYKNGRRWLLGIIGNWVNASERIEAVLVHSSFVEASRMAERCAAASPRHAFWVVEFREKG